MEAPCDLAIYLMETLRPKAVLKEAMLTQNRRRITANPNEIGIQEFLQCYNEFCIDPDLYIYYMSAFTVKLAREAPLSNNSGLELTQYVIAFVK